MLTKGWYEESLDFFWTEMYFKLTSMLTEGVENVIEPMSYITSRHAAISTINKELERP